jgi:hypothetical protein
MPGEKTASDASSPYLKGTDSWEVTLCSLIEVYLRFGGKLVNLYHFVCCYFGLFFDLKMKTLRFCEISANFYRTTECNYHFHCRRDPQILFNFILLQMHRIHGITYDYIV